MYTISEIAKMFNLSISTLRYYDKENLLPNIQRNSSNNRIFDDKAVETLRIIECLKKSGMQLKEIKEFIKWCTLGDNTLLKRKEMFYKQKENIKAQIDELEKTLNMINYKCWYYEEALKDGNENRVKDLNINEMPPSIKECFLKAHK